MRFSISKSGDLISEDYDAIVDEDQDIGCLYGLRNKLVLLDRNQSQLPQRYVLVTFGSIIIERSPNHLAITIDLKDQHEVKHFRYHCDDYLKIIQSKTNRQASLFLTYLHAITAFVLPDPLNSQTGTARALQILRGSNLKSTEPLSSEEISLLESIARLTPERRYKPEKKKELQSVRWIDDLGPISQHDNFHAAAKTLKDL